MAHRRAFRRKRRGPKRVRQKKAVTRLIKSVLAKRVETKHFYAENLTGISASTAPTFTCLSEITQAITDTGRIGDKVHLTRLSIQVQVVGYDTTNTVRLLFFRWRPNNADLPPSATALLLAYAVDGFTVLRALNDDRRGEFHVIGDYRLRTNTTIQTVLNRKFAFYGKRLGAKHINFLAAGVTAMNHVYMMVVSDSGVVGHPTVYYTSQLRYTDA